VLARAVAGTPVDFFAASGSSFVEMFVGRGAAPIRRLFKVARKSGRAVVFIDELDAVGAIEPPAPGTGAPRSASRRSTSCSSNSTASSAIRAW
jgi:cell division protease FtsH